MNVDPELRPAAIQPICPEPAHVGALETGIEQVVRHAPNSMPIRLREPARPSPALIVQEPFPPPMVDCACCLVGIPEPELAHHLAEHITAANATEQATDVYIYASPAVMEFVEGMRNDPRPDAQCAEEVFAGIAYLTESQRKRIAMDHAARTAMAQLHPDRANEIPRTTALAEAQLAGLYDGTSIDMLTQQVLMLRDDLNEQPQRGRNACYCNDDHKTTLKMWLIHLQSVHPLALIVCATGCQRRFFPHQYLPHKRNGTCNPAESTICCGPEHGLATFMFDTADYDATCACPDKQARQTADTKLSHLLQCHMADQAANRPPLPVARLLCRLLAIEWRSKYGYGMSLLARRGSAIFLNAQELIQSRLFGAPRAIGFSTHGSRLSEQFSPPFAAITTTLIDVRLRLRMCRERTSRIIGRRSPRLTTTWAIHSSVATRPFGGQPENGIRADTKRTSREDAS